MRLTLTLVASIGLASLGISSTATEAASHQSNFEPFVCPVTQPNGRGAPNFSGANNHGNDALITQLWPHGTVVFRPGGPGFLHEDDALSMKFPWWRVLKGPLTIEGRRLDAEAPPLRARVPCCYGETGFQPTNLIFPTPGCWAVTGRVGDGSLTFVTRVEKVGTGPVRNGMPLVQHR